MCEKMYKEKVFLEIVSDKHFQWSPKVYIRKKRNTRKHTTNNLKFFLDKNSVRIIRETTRSDPAFMAEVFTAKRSKNLLTKKL